jgi:hypothetical protein
MNSLAPRAMAICVICKIANVYSANSQIQRVTGAIERGISVFDEFTRGLMSSIVRKLQNREALLSSEGAEAGARKKAWVRKIDIFANNR